MKFSALFPRTVLLALCGTTLTAVEPAANLPDSTSIPAKPQTRLRLVDQFDRNGDHLLDTAERVAARAYLAQHPLPAPAPPAGRTAPVPVQAAALEPTKPGEKLNAANLAVFPGQDLYAPGILRTVSLEFENPDWEAELREFARTDVAVPVRLALDGQTYSGVSAQFLASDSTPTTGPGYKRALRLTINPGESNHPFGDQAELVLLDASTDPTLLRSMLYSHVARQFTTAPRTNFVRLAINGENWGIYVSPQPFDEKFAQANFGTKKGARWFVSPGGNLTDRGDSIDAYRGNYHLLSEENPAAWTALADFCRILNHSPARQLEHAIAPRLDIDSALRFLALQTALINQDGYGGATGGYGLYLAEDGRFHLVPLDAEASFRLVEVSEYAERSHRESKSEDRKKDENGKIGTSEKDAARDAGNPALQNYDPKNFPRQTGTDLAMLLSYSFINKADSDYSGKINQEKWLTFARSWFMVMDEDFVGKLTRTQFLAKFRGVLTPASIADGRTKQTFGQDDAAKIIGEDFFKALDRNQDGALTSQEVVDTFARWFADWSDPKAGILTQKSLQAGFDALFSRTVFQADQTYIARRDVPIRADEVGGERAGRRGGSGIGLGLLHLGGGGPGKKSEGRSLITFSEELDPLTGIDDPDRPLFSKLLAVPVLRTRYLEYVREIAETWLAWSKLGPIAKQSHDLIAADVAKETHKATSYAHFVQELDQDTTQGARDGDAAPSLKSFIGERRKYLLEDERLR